VSKADWAGVSVPAMWSSAQAADTETAWQQVSAWQRTYDLLLHHELRLEACRDELTFAWPPDRSPAATAFVEYIDGLLASIRRAKDEAVENHKALAGVLASLAATRADMDRLKAEWDKHEAEDATMARNLPNDLFASGENWRETLNERARTRMTRNDQEVLEARLKFVDLSPPFDGGLRGPPGGPERPGQGGPTLDGTGATLANGPGHAWLMPPTVDPAPDVGGRLGLAGSAAVPPVGSGGSLIASPPGAGGGNPSQSPTPGIPALVPSSGLGQARDAGMQRKPGSAPNSAIGGKGFVVRPIPSVTGAVGARGATGEFGHETSRRVNPVGGLVGHAYGSTGIGAAPVGGLRSMGPDDGSRSDAQRTLHWDVAEGVPGVIQPLDDPPFVLGPGVIGMDT
jgi:hypothetical protein